MLHHGSLDNSVGTYVNYGFAVCGEMAVYRACHGRKLREVDKYGG